VLTFDARHIARGWLAVALASSTDKGRPQLHRTVSIEEFSTGVRLVATDSVVLLTAWVPALDCELEPEPDLSDAPIFRAVAMDPYGRARSFLGHVLALATEGEKDDTAPTVDVTMRLSATDAELGDDGGPARTLDGFELRHVVLELPGSERLKLRSYDGTYPEWRRVVTAFRPVRTAALGLNPEVVARLAKVGRIFPGHHLGWTFGGVDKMARIEVIGAHPYVTGVVMPVRWDFDADAPREDTPPADDGDQPTDTATTDPAPADDEGPAPDPVELLARFSPDEDHDSLRPVYELTADGKAVL